MIPIKSFRLPIVLILASLVFGVSCEKKGPAEKAGEQIDKKMEEVGDKIDGATN